MYNDKDKKEIKKFELLFFIIWSGTIIPYIIYLYMVNQSIGLSLEIDREILSSEIFIIYATISGISLVIGCILHNKIFNDVHFSNTKISKLFNSLNKREEIIITNSETNISINLSTIFSIYTVSIGLVHIPALFGLVLALTTQTLTPFYLLWGTSILGILIIKPKLKKLLTLYN